MKVSVIGTGRMGQGLMGIFAPQYENLVWSSQSKEKVTDMISEKGFNVESASMEEALQADIIVHTLWFRDVIPWAQQYKEQLKGKILIDISNPFNEDFSNFVLDWGRSAAEELQRIIPETRVVGAFKNTFFKVLEEPIHNGLESDVYVTSNDEGAKKVVLDLFSSLPFRFFDGGKLDNNRVIERMTLFERELSIRYGHYPYVSFRLWGN